MLNTLCRSNDYFNFYFRAWWPFLVVLFYILAPLPTIIARRYTEHTGASSSNMDIAIFITMGFVVSSFFLPLTLARAPAKAPVSILPSLDPDLFYYYL